MPTGDLPSQSVIEAVPWPEISKVGRDQMDLVCDANACVVADFGPESLSSSQD